MILEIAKHYFVVSQPLQKVRTSLTKPMESLTSCHGREYVRHIQSLKYYFELKT